MITLAIEDHLLEWVDGLVEYSLFDKVSNGI